MRTALRMAAVLLAATTLTASAVPRVPGVPYGGKWKLNVAKSDFGQLTLVYEALPGGAYKGTMDGLSFTFTLDGKESPTPWGETTAWKVVNATTWEFTNRAAGKVTSTNLVKISADGKSMQVSSNMTNPNGQRGTVVLTMQRVAGGPGLAGTWKAAKMSSDAPTSIEIIPVHPNSLTFRYTDQGGECTAALDGKDAKASGPLWPAGSTCAMTSTGSHSFNIVWKKDGKPMYASSYVVSVDLKTLTENGGSANTTEKVKAVYDRQ